MAYDINDESLAQYMEAERQETRTRRGVGRWRPTAAGLKRLGVEAQKGAFGVGRASFYPFDLPGLVAWYRADRGVSADPSTGRLRAWQDLSSGGNPVLPIVPSTLLPPVLVGNAWDGKPTVRFVRADGVGLTTDPRRPPAMATASFFFALDLNSLPASAGTQYRLIAGTSLTGGNPDRFICYITNSGGTVFLEMFAGTAVFGTKPVLAPSRHLCSYIFNGASSRMRLDQGADDTVNPGTNDCIGWTLGGDGATASCDVDLAEVLIYNRAVSLPEQQTIEQYLAREWNAF